MATAPTIRRRRVRARAAVAPAATLRRIPITAGLLTAGWAILIAAWTFGNPPFLAPDEPAHYVRAVAVGEGHLGATPAVRVPAHLWAQWRRRGGVTCNVGHADKPAACVLDAASLRDSSDVGTTAGNYPPLYYILPGLALRAGDDPFDADLLARLASALLSFAFLVVAVALLVARDSERLSLLGLVVAVTPMVLFVLATVNSSSLEIAAGIAFFAALLRLSRDSRPPPSWVWGAAAAAGLAVAVARATGVIWVVLDLVLFVALTGPRGALRIARGAPRAAVVTGGLLAAGVVVNRVWEQLNGNEITQQGPAAPGAPGVPAVHGWYWHGLQQLRRVFDEDVGVFGWLDSVMPNVAYPAWQAMVAAVLVCALIATRRRERWLLAAAVALVAAVAVVLSASLEATTGSDVQGRHVLPFAVVVPLLAGELVYRNRARLALVDVGALFAWIAVAAGALQAVAWYSNAHRQSVGMHGPKFFPAHAQWSPPLGWWPWLLAALAGATLVALSASRRLRLS